MVVVLLDSHSSSRQSLDPLKSRLAERQAVFGLLVGPIISASQTVIRRVILRNVTANPIETGVTRIGTTTNCEPLSHWAGVGCYCWRVRFPIGLVTPCHS